MMKTVFGSSLIYLFSTGLGVGMPFLLMPVLTRYLTIEEYGVAAMFATFVSIIGIVVGLNVHGAVARRYFDKDIHLKEYVSGTIFILLCSFVIVEVIVWLFSSELEAVFSISSSWLHTAVVVAFFSFIFHIQLALYQVKQQVLSYAKLQIVYAFFNAMLTLMLIIVFILGVEGRLYGQSLSAIFIGGFSFYLLYKQDLLSPKLTKSYVRDALSFGLLLVPHAVGGMLLLNVDRVIVNNFLGLSSAGLYMAAVQISLGFDLIGSSINKAFMPKLYAILTRNIMDEKIKVIKFTYLVFLLYAIATFLLCWFTDDILLLLAGETYLEVSPVLRLLFIMQGIHGMYYMVTNYLFFKIKVGQLAFTSISLGIGNVVLSLILIEDYGIEGVAFSSLVSIALQFFAVWYLSNKYCPMPWFDRKVFTV